MGKSSFPNIVSYHSYWKDFGSELINQRKDFYTKSHTLNPVPEAWQTEYSLLGNGYKEGYPDGYKLSEMECALSLAKVIMADLNITNTTGWQWWSTFAGGKHGGEARFCLIEAITKNDNSDGVYHLNKLFYSFGNFSHFIRPGMSRLGITRSDNLTDLQETSDIMFSAYSNNDENQLVLVAANVTDKAKEVNLNVKNSSGKSMKKQALYLTNEYSDLSKQEIDLSTEKIIVPARSVVTFTADLVLETSVNDVQDKFDFKAWFNASEKKIVATGHSDFQVQYIRLFSISGNLLQSIKVEKEQNQVFIPASSLPEGIYFVSGEGNGFRETKKVVVTKH